MDWLSETLQEAVHLKHLFVANHREKFDAAAFIICRAILGGGKMMACGNGGSASDASHFVAELVGRFKVDRSPLPAISLVSDPATVTAIANDYGYETVFERQVTGLGRPGDVLIAISTSGQSKNVVNAALAAERMGIQVISFVGEPVCPLAELSHVVFSVPRSNTARIQEVHIFGIHILCEMIDRFYLMQPSTLLDQLK